MEFVRYLPLILCALLMSGCSNASEDENDQLKDNVLAFADAYFNYDFTKAKKYCTDESLKWFQFAASNMHEADLEILRQQDERATVEIENIQPDDNDSTGSVVLHVSNYMKQDTIGKGGRMVESAFFRFSYIRRNGMFQIKMDGLPRNEKRNRG